MLLEKTKIYGVDGVGLPGSTLTRTDAAVGLSYFIGPSEITSDFNSCYPWSEMQEVTDEYDNVFIRIPKFYTKITKGANGACKYQISGCRYDGFSTLFIDGKGNETDYVLVGKYEGSGSSSRVYSKSGKTVLVNINIGNFRNGCRANGEGYQQYDFLIDAILKQLFMIEFATTDCQSIMKGWTAQNNSAALITGHTDTVKTPSGSANANHASNCTTCNTDGYHACKYRGIENLWGNVWTWCDGISFSSQKIFICTDPTAYESAKTSAPYFYMGDRTLSEGRSSVITQFQKMPLLGFTTTASSSATAYPDLYRPSGSGTVLCVSGDWSSGTDAGLWYWDSCCGASYSVFPWGGRLCYKPV